MSQQLENAYQWIEVGIREYNAKRYEKCLYACERAIQLDPDCAKAYHGKGLALARLKRYEEALITYQKASLLAPEDAKLHANVAGVLFYKGDYENSGLSYKKAIQLDSQFETIYVEKLKVLLNKAFKWLTPYLPTLDRLKAIKAFRKVLLFDPDDATALAEIGKIQKERGLALAQFGRDEKAIEAYLEASQLNSEDAKLHADLAELFYYKCEYEKSRLSYKRASLLDSQFEAVYAEKSKELFDEAFKWLTPYLPTLSTRDLAVSAFRKILLFNPDDATTLVEIGKIQKEVEHLRDCPTIRYKGKLIYTDKRAHSASINVCSEQSDEEVKVFFLTEVKDSRDFSKTPNGWEISFTFPLPETYFRVEVLHNGVVIAYGYYWITYGYLRRDAEYNIYLTISYKPAGMSSEDQSDNRASSSMIYVPDRTGGRNRRVRRGS